MSELMRSDALKMKEDHWTQIYLLLQKEKKDRWTQVAYVIVIDNVQSTVEQIL